MITRELTRRELTAVTDDARRYLRRVEIQRRRRWERIVGGELVVLAVLLGVLGVVL